jgi:hypothetical protein
MKKMDVFAPTAAFGGLGAAPAAFRRPDSFTGEAIGSDENAPGANSTSKVFEPGGNPFPFGARSRMTGS